MNAPFPACRKDFQSEEAYKEWRTTELAALQQEMLTILQRSPELVKSPSSDGQDGSASSASSSSAKRASAVVTEAGEAYVGRRISSNATVTKGTLPIAEQFASTLSFGDDSSTNSSAGNTYSSVIPWPSSPSSTSHQLLPSTTTTTTVDEQSSSSSNFTFIPPNSSARTCYLRLLSIMLTYDLEAMSTLDPSEEVSLRILSKTNQEILESCFYRWRIFKSTKFIGFLDEMTSRYARDEMPVVECVTEALGDFDELNENMPVDYWPTIDVSLLSVLLSSFEFWYLTFHLFSFGRERPSYRLSRNCSMLCSKRFTKRLRNPLLHKLYLPYIVR